MLKENDGLLLHQVNLAHQGMGDEMGNILADCLVGLPVMHELDLRDNRLTDKGLMPIVQVRYSRLFLTACLPSRENLDKSPRGEYFRVEVCPPRACPGQCFPRGGEPTTIEASRSS